MSTPAENFESFDDIIAEAEAEPEPGTERQGDAEHAVQRRSTSKEKDQAAATPGPSKDSGRASAETPAPPETRGSEPGTKQGAGPTPPRRRKISFV